jgi:hypothetical protein
MIWDSVCIVRASSCFIPYTRTAVQNQITSVNIEIKCLHLSAILERLSRVRFSTNKGNANRGILPVLDILSAEEPDQERFLT